MFVGNSKVIAAFFENFVRQYTRRTAGLFPTHELASVLPAVGCCVFGLWVIAVVPGCKESIGYKSIPAPIAADVSYEVIGRVHRVLEGDLLEADVEGKLHCVLIRGVDSPKFGQEFYHQSVKSTRDMVRGKDLRIIIVGRDESMIEIADVMAIDNDGVRELDVGLELIRQGLAWYDGNEFSESPRLSQAEANARSQGIGLWCQANPVPPWEFETAKQSAPKD